MYGLSYLVTVGGITWPLLHLLLSSPKASDAWLQQTATQFQPGILPWQASASVFLRQVQKDVGPGSLAPPPLEQLPRCLHHLPPPPPAPRNMQGLGNKSGSLHIGRKPPLSPQPFPQREVGMANLILDQSPKLK
jgi:hypothetical protein